MWKNDEEKFRGTVFLRQLPLYEPLPPLHTSESAVEEKAEELEGMEPFLAPKLRVFPYAGGYHWHEDDTLLLHALVFLRRSYFPAELIDIPKGFLKAEKQRAKEREENPLRRVLRGNMPEGVTRILEEYVPEPPPLPEDNER